MNKPDITESSIDNFTWFSFASSLPHVWKTSRCLKSTLKILCFQLWLIQWYYSWVRIKMNVDLITQWADTKNFFENYQTIQNLTCTLHIKYNFRTLKLHYSLCRTLFKKSILYLCVLHWWLLRGQQLLGVILHHA